MCNTDLDFNQDAVNDFRQGTIRIYMRGMDLYSPKDV